jgi:hypothetical protein
MKRTNMALLSLLLVWLVAPALGGVPRRLYEGEPRAVTRHADSVAAWAMERSGGTAPTGLAPDSALFQGEWDLGACQMTVLGLVQVIEQQPGTEERYLPAVRACGSWLARRVGTSASAPGARTSWAPPTWATRPWRWCAGPRWIRSSRPGAS